MQNPNQHSKASTKTYGSVKPIQAQNDGTKGHSKPGNGGPHAGPPPAPQPQQTKK